MSDHLSYENPLVSRYASKEMSFLFSPQFKYTTWRRLWVALAKAEQSLGLPITDAQIQELESHVERIDFTQVAEIEKEIRHDVMAHIHAYGLQCPSAKGIIHLGCTSAYVADNTDIIQMQEGLKLLRPKLIHVLQQLKSFAKEQADLVCLSFTHFQAAQPTTIGRRACLWIQDLLSDLADLDYALKNIRFLGVKGATGTQASFCALFQHDEQKVVKLDEKIAQEMGFDHLYRLTSQTYPRKQDVRVFTALAALAVSCHKFAVDMRLLAHLKEVEEPFFKSQVGSSAMPYKRNPMLSERICSLSRYLLKLAQNPAETAANQWLERSLDDSANRRLTLAEGFLCADGILDLMMKVTRGLVVYPKMVEKHVKEELPFLASENILMAAVKKGRDRQGVHERLRVHAMEAGQGVKLEGKEGNFLELVASDPAIGLTLEELNSLMKVENFIGRSKEQIQEFLALEVEPVLKISNVNDPIKIPTV